MSAHQIIKKYSNGEVTILWEPSKCIHSGNCVKNLPSVFQPKTQPWIKIEAADSSEIIATVHKCPSGALSIIETA